MTIQTLDVENSDYEIFKYSQFVMTKARQFVTHYYHNFEANKIFKNVYLGSIDSVYDIAALRKLKIKNIVSVIADFSPPYPDDFNYLVVNALDTTNTNLTKIFDKVNDFIDDSLDDNKAVLIHCYAGRSRSVAVLIAYMIRTYGMKYEDALKSIKNVREIAEPNESFKEQLIIYYNSKYIV